MADRDEFQLDPQKLLDPRRVRLNLMLASLYLTAFETLKLAVIEEPYKFLVIALEITDESYAWYVRELGQDKADRIRDQYQAKVQEYEKELGISADKRHQIGLIPSCQWLERMEALDPNDTEDVRRIRDHRNQIAHKLPYLLSGKDLEIDLALLARSRQLIAKIDKFWMQSEPMLMDLQTGKELDPTELTEGEIYSGRLVVLDKLMSTVVEYIEELTSTREKTNVHDQDTA